MLPRTPRRLTSAISVALITLACGGPLAAAQDKAPPATQPATQPSPEVMEQARAAFAEGVEAMQADELEEAEAAFARVVELDSSATNAWYNLADLRRSLDDYEGAIEAADRVIEAEPNTTDVRALKTQMLHTLGRDEAAQACVDELLAARAAAPGGDEPYFRREWLTVGGTRLLAVQHYELEGERAVRYVFYVVEDEKVKERYSLGSYEMTTLISRQMGEIGPDERLFHLDYYPADGGHKTFGFYDEEPTYVAARAAVERAILGDDAAVSETTKDGTIRIDPTAE